MKKDKFLLVTYCIYLLLLFISIVMQYSEKKYSNSFIFVTFLFSLQFLAIALPEIFKSSKINGLEKFNWLIKLIFVFPIAGLVYINNGRKRLVSS